MSRPKPRLLYTPCNPHQAGALLYTNNQYTKLDPERRIPKWIQWLKVRNNWFSQQINLGHKQFNCIICGKTNLNPWTKNKNQLATIDHIKPVSVYPRLWNDPSNFQVTCYNCNQKKGCDCD